jgi:hypothetical protein
VGPTFIDGDLETINDGHRLLNDAGPDEQWTEVHWVLHEAVAALERIRAALTDLTLDAWAAVPDTEAEGRYDGHLFGEAMGLSGAAAYANLPPSVWASPQRQPLVELRRISNAERAVKP